jgi:hypothetical protein
MVLVTSNPQQKLLYFNYVQRVSVPELEAARQEAAVLLANLTEGICLLADLSQVETMDPDGVNEIGATMDMINRAGVKLIVRVIPDSSKDMGLNILTVFHYPHRPRVITCRTLAEALHQLSLWK